MNKTKCRGCGKPIIFIKSTAGKYIPCNPTPVYYKRNENGPDKIVTEYGVVVSCEVTGDDCFAGTEVGYRPHWATCPAADTFRKRG